MTIDNLEIEIKSKSDEASKGVLKLASALTTLKQVTKGGAGLTSTVSQLSKLSTALSSIRGTAKLQELTKTLSKLSHIKGDSSGLSSAMRQLKKLPDIARELNATDMNKFAQSINKVVKAIKPLANEMEKVSRGFSALPSQMNKIINQNAKVSKAKNKNGLFGGLKLGAMLYIGQRIGSVLGDWINKSNDYVENLNLFTVAMGEYAGEAKEYAELVGEKMGIDPSEWMRAQGIFNTLATGFGLANDKASIMSKNLTQLSYDISSLYNIKVQDAMTKLQSAFSGELEPVRRLGYDLSQTKLQAIATSKGITKQVSKMNQAEKSMLRYYALMTQVTEAQGDMARTLESPANQLRILNAQLIQTKRALGNIFIPALMKVLPYLNAFLRLIRAIADHLATLFHFKLPEFDYSKVNQLGTGISDNFDKATESAKKLKNYTAGFDELNILDKNDGGSGLGDLGGAGFDMDLPQYNFMEGLQESESNKIFEGLKKHLAEIEGAVVGIGIGFLMWKLSDGFTLSLAVLKSNLIYILGVVSVIAGSALLVAGAFSAWQNGLDWNNLALMIAGILLITLALGSQIGFLVGGLALISIGFIDAWNNGLNLQNLSAIFIGLILLGTVIALTLGSVALIIFLIIGAVALLVLGVKDLVDNGVNSKSLTAIFVGLTLITIALFMAFGWVGLIIGLVIALAVVMVIFADKTMGTLYVIGAFFQNIWILIKNFGKGVWAIFKNIGKFLGNFGLGIWEAIKALVSNLITAFQKAWLKLKIGFLGFQIFFLDKVKMIAEKINKLLGVFGIEIDLGNLDAQLTKLKDSKASTEKELSAKEYKDIGEAFKKGNTTYEYDNVKEAFHSEEAFKEGWRETAWGMGEDVGNEFKENLRGKLKGAFGGDDKEGEDKFGDVKGKFEMPKFDIESFSTGLDNSKMGMDLSEMNLTQTESLDKLTTTDTNITGMSKMLDEKVIGTQGKQLASSDLLNKNTMQNKTEIVNAISSATSSIVAGLSAVRVACENIKINVTKVYSGKGYATGGFPSTGSMFIAREAGPEMVGRIGNKTAVANNDQITQGIANAVYNAMVSASANNNQDIKVYISGKQVNASVEKAKREKGTSIMTGGLIYG